MTAAVQSTTSALSDEDLAMLRFAGLWWKQGGSSDAAIVERFGMPPTRFYQRLAFLVEHVPAARAAEPVIVGRLERVVAARRAGRRHTTGDRP